MRGGLLVLGTAAAAVACCVGISLVTAAGGTALLALAGTAVPVAALIGIGGWITWRLVRSRQGARER
jgi:hypothetical protein